MLVTEPIQTADHLATALRAALDGGTIRPGDRLPTERVLAARHGLPRSAVRRALARLAEDGLVDRRLGSGTFARGEAHSDGAALGDIADGIAPLHLIEVRAALEPEVSRLAARDATLRDIAALRDALAELDRCGNDVRRFADWDERFHLALAEATRNPLMVWLYRRMNEVRGRAGWMTVRDEKLTAARMADYNRLHLAIVDAIEARDPEAAASCMARHMAEARADFMP